MTESNKLTIFAPEGAAPDERAIAQIENCLTDERAVAGALMSDHHLGYSLPIGGVVKYDNAISPSGVGFDIACGNMAVRTNLNLRDFLFPNEPELSPDSRRKVFQPIMREIQRRVEFGIGRSNATLVDDPVLDDSSTWRFLEEVSPGLRTKAANQLGTVGAGNHYVDLLMDEDDQIWTANHFGSRGLGHTIASGFMSLAAGRKFSERVAETEDPIVFNIDSPLGEHYLACMHLAGKYAYAGREYVTAQVLSILGAEAVETVHNHHNFAWFEDGHWVVRKGATPLTTAPAFIGGSMGDVSVIVRGMLEWVEVQDLSPKRDLSVTYEVADIGALDSAPHGAGRVMSRTAAAGKMRKMWYCNNRNCDFVPIRSEGANTPFEKNHCPKCDLPLRKGRMRDVSTAAIDWNQAREELTARGITVLGAGADESPGVYKDLSSVIAAHSNIEILHTLRPLGVVMAGSDIYDPFAD